MSAPGLRPLLGNSVFLTNGAEWQRQRRIINPAFEGGRLRDTFAPMRAAAQAMVARLHRAETAVEIEEMANFGAADVIFRTLFSVPIEDQTASEVFREFRTFQRSQPILNLAAFLPLPRWFPRFYRAKTRSLARRLHGPIEQLVAARLREITDGTAPDDLATKIMTQSDPITGSKFDLQEMVDQVAIFFWRATKAVRRRSVGRFICWPLIRVCRNGSRPKSPPYPAPPVWPT